MQPATTWHQPMRKIVFARKDDAAKTFTVTLHSHCDKEAASRAKEILRICHPDSARHFGAPSTQIIAPRDYEARPLRGKPGPKPKGNSHAHD